MKLDDIFFAIGIIIISSLLVFVIYDDLTNPYPDFMDEINEINEVNASDKYNITENDTKLLHNSGVNNAVNIESSQKTKTTTTQSSGGTTVTQKLDKNPTVEQNSDTQKNNINKEVKTNNENSKHSNIQNTHNEKSNRQNEPVNKEL